MVPLPGPIGDMVRTGRCWVVSWALIRTMCGSRESFAIAREQGIAFSFTPDLEETEVHPNTVDIHMMNKAGQEMRVRGESLGGGKARICRINQVEVDFTGEYSAAIVIHQDRPGVVAHITSVLSRHGVNIAFMRLFREGKGDIAYTIVESDDGCRRRWPGSCGKMRMYMK